MSKYIFIRLSIKRLIKSYTSLISREGYDTLCTVVRITFRDVRTKSFRQKYSVSVRILYSMIRFSSDSGQWIHNVIRCLVLKSFTVSCFICTRAVRTDRSGNWSDSNCAKWTLSSLLREGRTFVLVVKTPQRGLQY